MIYRVILFDSVEGSEGFEYCSSLGEAKKIMSNYKNSKETHKPTFDKRETPKNKREIVLLLNEWASHYDNG